MSSQVNVPKPPACSRRSTFLEVDPVAGGSCNDYDYVCGDPINYDDIGGTMLARGDDQDETPNLIRYLDRLPKPKPLLQTWADGARQVGGAIQNRTGNATPAGWVARGVTTIAVGGTVGASCALTALFGCAAATSIGGSVTSVVFNATSTTGKKSNGCAAIGGAAGGAAGAAGGAVGGKVAGKVASKAGAKVGC